MAIPLLNYKQISLMKRMLSTVGIDVRSKKIDLGVLHGRPMSEKGLIDTALELVEKLQGDEGVEEKTLIEEMMKTGKYRTREEAYKVLNTLLRNGQVYEVKPGKYSKRVDHAHNIQKNKRRPEKRNEDKNIQAAEGRFPSIERRQ